MKCCVCQQEIPVERAEALELLGKIPALWTCIEHGDMRRVKGVFAGEYGTSQLILASSVGEDEIDKSEVLATD